MWKLCHRLFGWDYVRVMSQSGFVNEIRRVRTTPNGREYVKLWSSLPDIIFLDEPWGLKIAHLTRKDDR